MASKDLNMQEPLKTLWFDLKASVQINDTPAVFEKFCNIRRVHGIDGRQVESFEPDLVVFEFDYPSRADMEHAAGFKLRHANIPMIVLTVQHSEALAVWFFRKKFIDFLVQPITAGEATHCLNEISRITSLRRGQEKRKLTEKQSSLPPEVSQHQGASNPLLPAVALIETAYFEQLTVMRAAEACGMQPFKFGRVFKEDFGIDFREYVVRYRVREACRLLRNPNAQVSEVAYAVGFSEPSYFAKTFKKLVGVRPSDAVGRQDLEFKLAAGLPQ
jgi:AraC-like DNA-binding protein